MLDGQVTQNSERVENLTRLVLQIDGLENKVDASKKFDLIMNAIDGLAAKIDNYKVEKSTVDHSLQSTFTKAITSQKYLCADKEVNLENKAYSRRQL